MLTFRFKALRKALSGKNLAYGELDSGIGNRSLKSGGKIKTGSKSTRTCPPSATSALQKISPSQTSALLRYLISHWLNAEASRCGVLF